ncbi:class I SAM-dependent methyltransferase [Aquimarina sp. 2201CG5-10]|uniref:class I SAM-dependent methyltransferase n=1 Tax=Aquimarina callyspongiae TaxID=3098150 RepID=UPI002AB5CAEB|nr:class I SAM-dependent methyltransferase [Aquimarina sp. 2201CG5-10]MDY8133982.1 class I SAM-dependent methyltransferase [Aquimarina sp. 2201CG5-10]
MHTDFFLTPKAEEARYQLHNNNVEDPGYQKFVSPIVQTIFNDFDCNHQGLDFGSGTAPVITSLLHKQKYNVTTYDPFFNPDQKALEKTYDYIICCEVMEHFYNPAKEFELLYSLLKKDGVLYCKTNLFNESIDFKTWWYKNDDTHVFFYTRETLEWICNKYGFKNLNNAKNLIVFKK